MTLHGAAVVIGAILAGLWFSITRGFDGAQTFMACALAWMLFSACYHAAGSVLIMLGYRRRRRR